jgi:hypothetical protein
VGASTSIDPIGPHGLLQLELYLFYVIQFIILYALIEVNISNKIDRGIFMAFTVHQYLETGTSKLTKDANLTVTEPLS